MVNENIYKLLFCDKLINYFKGVKLELTPLQLLSIYIAKYNENVYMIMKALDIFNDILDNENKCKLNILNIKFQVLFNNIIKYCDNDDNIKYYLYDEETCDTTFVTSHYEDMISYLLSNNNNKYDFYASYINNDTELDIIDFRFNSSINHLIDFGTTIFCSNYNDKCKLLYEEDENITNYIGNNFSDCPVLSLPFLLNDTIKTKIKEMKFSSYSFTNEKYSTLFIECTDKEYTEDTEDILITDIIDWSR